MDLQWLRLGVARPQHGRWGDGGSSCGPYSGQVPVVPALPQRTYMNQHQLSSGCSESRQQQQPYILCILWASSIEICKCFGICARKQRLKPAVPGLCIRQGFRKCIACRAAGLN